MIKILWRNPGAAMAGTQCRYPPPARPKATLDERVSARVSCFVRQQLSETAGQRVPSSVRREDTIESRLRGVERKTTYATLRDRALREVGKEP